MYAGGNGLETTNFPTLLDPYYLGAISQSGTRRVGRALSGGCDSRVAVGNINRSNHASTVSLFHPIVAFRF